MNITKAEMNPEWTALSDKPHLVPLCCMPNQYKSVTELAAEYPNLGEYLAQLERHNAILQELVRRHALAVDALTEKQLAEAIRQAIACGDFQRLVVTTGDGAQQVIYIPFAEQARLQARIRELEGQLDRELEGELEILRDYDDRRD